MSELRVFRNDTVDWVIAESPDEASKIADAYWGFAPDDPHDWIECDPDEEWEMVEGPRAPMRRTFREWIASEGRGFLGTTEY